jgi:hypothetical protein
VDVTDSARRPCFKLLFASVDSTIDHLTPELRASVEKVCSQSASLSETILTIKNSLTATKALRGATRAAAKLPDIGTSCRRVPRTLHQIPALLKGSRRLRVVGHWESNRSLRQ